MPSGPAEFAIQHHRKPLAEDYDGEMVDALPGVNKRRRTAFTASANRPDVSGKSARHARHGGWPPRYTMTLNEGREFIADLVTAWIGSKRL